MGSRWACSLAALWVLFGGSAEAAERVPSASYRYQRFLTQQVRLYWGYSERVAVFAAQVHQESRWNPTAASVFASGLGQQTPETAKWLSKMYPADLPNVNTMDPLWSLRALVVYDKRLWDGLDRRKVPATDNNRWRFVLAEYNGGTGWVLKEQKKAAEAGRDPKQWICNTEHFRARAEWAFQESRDYPRSILLRWLTLYLGWG